MGRLWTISVDFSDQLFYFMIFQILFQFEVVMVQLSKGYWLVLGLLVSISLMK